MKIDWEAVLFGWGIALALGLVVGFVTPIDETSVFYLSAPGLVGGFAAGFIVSGVERGAVHGGLATVLSAIVLLVVLSVTVLLFEGVIVAVTGALITFAAIVIQAIPGAIAGAAGGWVKERRTAEANQSTPGSSQR